MNFFFKAIKILGEMTFDKSFTNFDHRGDAEIENILGLYVANIATQSDSIDDEYSSINDFCLKYRPANMSDAASTLENKVFTSAKVVKAGVNGAGTIAHEVAHRLYSVYGQASAESLLTCLKDRHFGFNPQLTNSLSRGTYLVEDSADHFSNLVLREMGYTARNNNLACLFFQNAQFVRDGFNLPLFYTTPLHPMVSPSDESHSAPTFRLLQIANDLGHSTESCREYAQAEASKVFQNENGVNFQVPTVRQCDPAQ